MKPTHRLRSHAALLIGVLSLAASSLLQAQSVPQFIDYQGIVKDGSGNPLAQSPAPPANYEIEFRIYDAATAGNVIWAEKQLVTVSNGQFSVRLGEGQAILGGGGADIGSVGHSSPGLGGAFEAKDRFLGVTVNIPGQAPGEITPRLSFLSAPFAMKSASASSVVQAAGTTSNLTIGSIAYATQTLSTSAAIDGSSRTVLVNSTSASHTATLPVSGAQKEILIAKTDSTANQVIVAPPGGGTINGNTDSIRLKVKGESITLQNVGGNDWWITNDNRDKTPVGTIIAYSSNNVPAGYLRCDGAQPVKATYPELVAVLGTNWGVPGNANNFRVPDLRGAFLRGRDSGRGLDDGRASRTADFTGGATGDNIGSYQHDDFRAHGHSVNDPGHSHGASVTRTANTYINYRNFLVGNGGRGYNPDVQDGTSTNGIIENNYSVSISTGFTGISINSAGGAETRPDNYNVNYCIKY